MNEINVRNEILESIDNLHFSSFLYRNLGSVKVAPDGIYNAVFIIEVEYPHLFLVVSCHDRCRHVDNLKISCYYLIY